MAFYNTADVNSATHEHTFTLVDCKTSRRFCDECRRRSLRISYQCECGYDKCRACFTGTAPQDDDLLQPVHVSMASAIAELRTKLVRNPIPATGSLRIDNLNRIAGGWDVSGPVPCSAEEAAELKTYVATLFYPDTPSTPDKFTLGLARTKLGRAPGDAPAWTLIYKDKATGIGATMVVSASDWTTVVPPPSAEEMAARRKMFEAAMDMSTSCMTDEQIEVWYETQKEHEANLLSLIGPLDRLVKRYDDD